MTFDRQRFITDVLSLVDREKPIPWIHQGRDPEIGVDCIGMPRWAVTRQIRLPEELEREFDAYHHRPDGWRMLEIMRRHFIEIPTGDQQELKNIEGHQPGDLVQMYLKRNPCHMGVLVSDSEVVEAFSKAGFAEVRKGSPRLRIAAIFRIPEIVNT